MGSTLTRPSTKIVWKPHPGSQVLALSCPADEILYHGTRGPGKGLPLSEPVYTERGPRPIGELKVGDWVACPDGSQSRIIGVFPQGKRPTYEIEFADGAIARCDDQHIWPIHTQDGNKPGSVGEYGYKLMLTPELVERFRNGKAKLHVPTLDSLNMRYKTHAWNNKLEVDPYLLGLLLGDGSFTQLGSFCTIDDELAEYVLNSGLKQWAKDSRSDVQNFGFTSELKQQITKLKLWDALSDSKFIPERYLHHMDENRLALLQGLMDTDGTVDKDGYMMFTSVSSQLAKDVQYIARSLGANATLTVKPSYFEGKRYKDAYEVYIQPGNKFVPFRLTRKVERVKGYMHDKLWKRIVDIRELGEQDTVCIKIDHPLGLFITRDFVVTHNTDAQLMRFRRYVGMGYGKHWRGIIFDREYKNLDDLVAKSQRWFPEFNDGCKFLSSKSDYKWVWPTGEELLFRVAKKRKDYWLYHGQEFPFIGWNELTKYPDGDLYEAMKSCNRTSFIAEENPIIIDGDICHETGQIVLVSEEHYAATRFVLPDLPLQIFATTNPFGVGHNWVKKYFINMSPLGSMYKETTNVFNPRTQTYVDIVRTRCHIFGSYRENRNLTPEYVAQLVNIDDPNLKLAWLGGSWDITAGGMFDDLWRRSTHVVRPFRIPDSWKIDRSFDWGSSKPFSVGWWARSDGSDVILADGSRMSTVPGDLFRIMEWYGTNGKPNEGLRMLDSQIARGIIVKELEAGLYGRVMPGAADNSIWDVKDGNSTAATMAKSIEINGKKYPGIQWKRSDKTPGSRKAGWKRMREYFAAPLRKPGDPIIREKPGIFIFDTCAHFIDLVPSLPRDEEDMDDVDTDAEDHVGDETRYRVLDENRGGSTGKTTGT